MEPFTGIILTGGNSTRMGLDKAMIEWDGSTFLERIIANLRPVCSEIMIVGDRPEYHDFGVPVIPDLIENIGPLGGILTGLKQSRTDSCFFIPCDMPLLGPDLIIKIITSSSDKRAIIPVVNERLQLLSSVYHKSVTDHLQKMIENGTRKVSLFADSLDIHKFTVEDQYIDQFRNFNFKEELEELINGNQS